jgi:hypothetical protein
VMRPRFEACMVLDDTMVFIRERPKLIVNSRVEYASLV